MSNLDVFALSSLVIVEPTTEIGTVEIETAEIVTGGTETVMDVEGVMQDVVVAVQDVLAVEIEEGTAVVVGVRDVVTLQAEEHLID